MCTKGLRGKSGTGRTTTNESIFPLTAGDYPPKVSHYCKRLLKLPWTIIGKGKEKKKKTPKVRSRLRHRQKNIESENIFMIINLFRFAYLVTNLP